MKTKNFLKVGEFAKICQTTKETILHYDRKGILKPKYIADNGYRCYGLEQYFEYDFISLLRESGCTIKEIKDNRESIGEKRYISFINKKIENMVEQQELLSRRILMLKRMVKMAEESELYDYDKLFFQNIDEENVIYYPVEHNKMFDRKECVICYSDFLIDRLKNGNTIDFPLGMVINKLDCKNNRFNISYLFRSFSDNESGIKKLILSGKYACMYHYGNMESHKNSFYMFIDMINKYKINIGGDMLIFDQMNYILFGLNTDFTAKYVMLVK